MDYYFPQSSEEYKAQQHIAEYVFYDENIGPREIGLTAAYAALNRFIKGDDLYIPPRDVYELQAVLRNYSDHVVNSLCSQVVSRVALRQQNGWAVARSISEKSLHRVLSVNNNLERLVALHSAPAVEPYVELSHLADAVHHPADETPRRIRTK